MGFAYLKRYRRIFIVSMCLLLITALTACQEGGLFVNNDENGETYTLSDNIIIPVAVLRDINPVTSQDDGVYQTTKLIYDSLINLDDTLMPKANLASSWQFSDDGTSITFTLNDGIKFSNGDSFTSNDVIFSYSAYTQADSPAYHSKIEKISGVETNGNDQVTFLIKNKANISIADFDFPIFSSKQFSSAAEFLKSGAAPLIGTGAYMIQSADIDKEIQLVPNEEYHGEKASNNIKLEVLPVTTPYSGLVNVGEITISIYTDVDREEISGNNELSITEFTSNQFEALGFNCADGFFADVNLRQAVAHMIDRDEIINTAYYNSGIKSDSLYYPGYCGTETNNEFTENESKVKDYLTLGNYADTDGDGYIENENGDMVSVKLVIKNDNEMRSMTAQLLTVKLAEYGIDVVVDEVNPESYEDILNDGSYDMFIGGWQVSEDYDLRSFYHAGYNNYAHYSNDKVDEYLDRLQSGLNDEDKKNTFTELKSLIDKDVPYICLLYKTYAAVTSANLEGTVAPQFYNYYYGCEQWKMRIYDTAKDDEESTEKSESQDS